MTAEPTAPPATSAPERIPFGRTPLPATGDEFAARVQRWLRDELDADALTDAQWRAREPEISARLAGADVRELSVDLTRIAIPFALPTGLVEPEAFDPATGHPLPAAPAPEPEPVVRRTPATLEELRLVGRPVVIAGLPVVVDGLARGIRFDWVETGDGELSIEEVPLADAAPLHGYLSASAQTGELVAALDALLRAALAEMGLRLKALEVTIEGSTRDALRLGAFARIGKGPFSASARLSTAVSVDRSFTLRIRRLRLTSANPIVAIALLFARRGLRAARRTRVPLAEQLPPGTRFAEFSVDAGRGDRVELVARLR
ncbi:hypothetical protein [Agromyces sp. NPDC058064]|uniref:hypothetical protein n=1 Tax=Agromyces sp. NPDC058064 TaxID=3346322 RepID=UPI0036DF3D14